MGLKTSCESCGKLVAGVTAALKNINGRDLCPDCALNPNGVLQYYCPACNMYFPNKAKKGNGWIELILYFFYIAPGIIYSVWRRTGNSDACPKCKSSSLISADAGTHIKCPECAELVKREAKVCKHCGCRLVPQ